MAISTIKGERGVLDELAEEQPYVAPPRGLYRMNDIPIGQWGGQTSRLLEHWEPTARQLDVLLSPVQELFFGGSRGPGKTDLLIADFDQQEQQLSLIHISEPTRPY